MGLFNMFSKDIGIDLGTANTLVNVIRNSLEEGLIDDVVLVSDEKMDEEYHERTRRDDSKRLVHWDTPIEDHKDVGRTTRAGINVALNIASRVEGKDMLIIGYDKADRYDV
ncbi:MAG: hypothetical protein IH845_03890 [Nanoarchaeota archaeon]|nr:hypothetical protein [Nanoarchaeota archaeon]